MIGFTPSFVDKRIKPLYVQLYDYIKNEITHGRLEAGSRLPSIRHLSSYLGISKNTVENAYQHLIWEGYVASKPKSGLFILPVEDQTFTLKRNLSADEKGDSDLQQIQYDFDFNNFQNRSFPIKAWRKHSNNAYFLEVNEKVNPYPNINGELSLRKEIADYLYQTRGFICKPEQVFITPGIRYSINFLTQVILKRHSNIAMENPGCPASRKIFK